MDSEYLKDFSLSSNDDGTPPNLRHKICGLLLGQPVNVFEVMQLIRSHTNEST